MQVKRGLTRTVLLIGRWAVKVPSFRSHGQGLSGVLWSFCRGVLANHSEILWAEEPGVCPLKWSVAGLINVYPRCGPVTWDPDYDAIGFTGPTDRKRANVGMLDGRMVWVDYDMNWNDRPPCQHV